MRDIGVLSRGSISSACKKGEDLRAEVAGVRAEPSLSTSIVKR